MNTSSPWLDLLANPGTHGHIVQLYQDDEFYGEAISHFAAEGLLKGESIIIVATAPHWENISRRLGRKGFKVADLRKRGQLTLLDADHTLPKFLVNDMPDAKTFKDLAHGVIEKARGGGKYAGVRWWGEMVNVLYVNGNQRGSTRLEELFEEVGDETPIALFCSFYMDKFDPKIYDGPIGDLCRTHSHLIPAEDYSLHKECIDRAVAEAFGKLDDKFLKILVSTKEWSVPGMPPSQALLLCLKQAAPEKFGQVLNLAKKYEDKNVARMHHG